MGCSSQASAAASGSSDQVAAAPNLFWEETFAVKSDPDTTFKYLSSAYENLQYNDGWKDGKAKIVNANAKAKGDFDIET